MNRILIFLLTCLLTLTTACKKDPCEDIACQNGGTCIEGDCECPEGFGGNFCESFDLQRYFGTYDISYQGCFTTSENHQVSVEQIPGESNRFLIHNLGDYECPSGEVVLSATTTSNTIAIESQTIDCGSIRYTFEGTGTFLNGNTINLDFSVSYDAGGFQQVDMCTASLGK